MTTPYMLLTGWARSVAVALWAIWITTLVLSRAHAFHDAYIAESQRLVDERYLLERCQDPEFYSNIRQHTGICAEVEANARSSTLLKALDAMAQGTHLCGSRPCAEAVRLAIGRLTWQAVGALALVALVFPNVLHAAGRSIVRGRREWVERDVIRRNARDGIRPGDACAPFYCDMEASEDDDEPGLGGASSSGYFVASDLRRRRPPPRAPPSPVGGTVKLV